MSGRAFIIGNGPSLNQTPLELLTDEVTFGVNRIHLIYHRTSWRATHYVAYDAYGNSIQIWMNDALVHLNDGVRCYLRADHAGMLERNRKAAWPSNVTYFTCCGEHSGMDITHPNKPTGWHLPKPCGYASTLGVAMQIAILEGHNPLYLVGCDLGFKQRENLRDSDPNHFHPGYDRLDDVRYHIDNERDFTTMSDFPISQRDATLIWMHQVAKKSCDEMGIQVYNATLGGILEVYPRVTLEDVLCQKK